MNGQKTWDEFSELDQQWAILTEPEKKYGKWTADEFLKSGEKDVGLLMIRLNGANIKFDQKKALDFGCGIGRNTKALAKFFLAVDGADISEKMVMEAKKNTGENINYFVNTAENFPFSDDKAYDLVFSVLTLQHQKNKNKIIEYLKEFARIAKDGGIIYFQLPSTPEYSLIKDLLLKARGYVYFFLKNFFFVQPNFLYNKLKLAPYMRMNYLTSSEIRSIFKNMQTIIFDDNSASTTYLIIKKNL